VVEVELQAGFSGNRIGRSTKRVPTVSHAAPLAGLALRCQSDARLVTLCREGQERAFEEIELAK
jgi:hypothetical protein